MILKWIGEHIWSLVSRFRDDIYLEDGAKITTSNNESVTIEPDGSGSVILGDGGGAVMIDTSWLSVDSGAASIDMTPGNLMITDGTANIDFTGGNLDITTSSGRIKLEADDIQFRGGGGVYAASLKLYESPILEGHAVTLSSPLSLTADYTLTLPDGDGNSNQVLKSNGSGILSWADVVLPDNPTLNGVVSIKPLGGGDGRLALYEDDGTNYVIIQAQDSLATNWTFQLPTTGGTSGQLLETNGSGTTRWVDPPTSDLRKVYFNGGVNLQYSFARWLPIGAYYIIEQNTATNPEYTTFVPPHDGKIIKILVRAEEALGNTSLTWYKAVDGTKTPATLIEAKTVNISAANTTYTYTYTGSATFSAGEALALKIDPTNDPIAAGVNYTIVYEFDEST